MTSTSTMTMTSTNKRPITSTIASTSTSTKRWCVLCRHCRLKRPLMPLRQFEEGILEQDLLFAQGQHTESRAHPHVGDETEIVGVRFQLQRDGAVLDRRDRKSVV